ncbi:hypothetical protein NE237_030744 [Protea cynaroides]|uniref:Uncharacterized protein n=1 Tax=Protea cynaroides TaxID=273540 RepID=A0A9Q0JWC2_9MAGN|nr:hypothetical protein NE237_030744 [Protea cynaroides]
MSRAVLVWFRFSCFHRVYWCLLSGSINCRFLTLYITQNSSSLSLFEAGELLDDNGGRYSSAKKVASPCGVCKGTGFYSCKLCTGSSTIEWSPLCDPVVINPCLCPTCEGNRVQRCLNCLGKGYF